MDDFSHNIYFYCRKKLKKHVFSPSWKKHVVSSGHWPTNQTSEELITLQKRVVRIISRSAFDMLQFLKRFYLYLKWKAFDLLYRVRYILGVVALQEVCDVTNTGRHFGRHLGFYQELEMRLKAREMVFFCALHEK